MPIPPPPPLCPLLSELPCRDLPSPLLAPHCQSLLSWGRVRIEILTAPFGEKEPAIVPMFFRTLMGLTVRTCDPGCSNPFQLLSGTYWFPEASGESLVGLLWLAERSKTWRHKINHTDIPAPDRGVWVAWTCIFPVFWPMIRHSMPWGWIYLTQAEAQLYTSREIPWESVLDLWTSLPHALTVALHGGPNQGRLEVKGPFATQMPEGLRTVTAQAHPYVSCLC